MLRPIRQADLGDIAAGIGNFSVSRMLARVPYPYTQRDAEWFLDYADREIGCGSMLYLGIESAGHIVGAVSIEGIPYTSELGYWLAEPAWGQGFMTEAVNATLAYAFSELGVRVVRSGYFVENRGSWRVQDKLGFRQTRRSFVRSLARGTEVAHIHSVLTAGTFRAAAREPLTR